MLEINHLEKIATQKMLIGNVNLTLHQGEIFALVGVRGSGKSLLSRLILTLATRTKGSVKIKGNQMLGAFIQNEQFLPNDTVITIIKDYCRLNNKSFNLKRTKNILGVLNIKNILRSRINKLNSSQIDRLKMALPLIVRADILVLDMPFTNLTWQEARDLRVLLKKVSLELKTAILITARHMFEVEEICDTIGIIDEGLIVTVKTYNEMISKEFDQAKLSVTVAQPNYAAKIIEQEFKVPVTLCGDKVIINLKPEQVQAVVDKLQAKNITVLSANRAYRSLENQYLEIINNRKKFY